jgi:hypothetical protein
LRARKGAGMSEIWQAVDSFDTLVRPQVNKLYLLREACSSGILGEGGILHKADYSRCSWGLHEILDDVIEVLDEFEKEINGLLDEERRKKESEATEA